ncbi:MAG TPA: hypothetical protein DCL38_08490 [Lachnospiraceae bacterium]|nr:hypothetical protein [Lachnospiraceae bacterium]
MRDRFKSLRAEIIAIIIGFSFLIALMVAILSFFISRRYLLESQRQSSYINIQLLGNEINSDLNSVIAFSNRLLLDPAVENYLSGIKAGSGEDRNADARKLSMDTWTHLNSEYRINSSYELINRFMVSVPDGSEFLHIARVQNNSTLTLAGNIREAPFFEELISSDDYSYIGLVSSPVNANDRVRILPVIRPVRRFYSSDIIGFIYLEIPADVIAAHINNIHFPEDCRLYLTFSDTATYRYENGEFVTDRLPSGLVDYSLPDKEIRISLLPSRSELRSRTFFYIVIVFLVLCFIILTGSVIYVLLRRMINDPVDALLLKLERTGNGDFSRDPLIEWDNELGQIGRGINDLSQRVDALIHERVGNERAKQALEYRVLQSQVNPHFMYNTLNTIKWMATIQGADGIADMSTALSRLLKNVSKSSEQIIPLQSEIELLNDYFTIMKYRYGGTIELIYEIEDDSLLTSPVNRFSLQPIVENAIFHGIEPKGSAGKITIHVYSKAAHLYIDVTDNGVGMDEELISGLFEGSQGGGNDFFKDVGIANVHNRIRFSFGEEYGLSAKSVPGEYTTIHFDYPLKNSADDEP